MKKFLSMILMISCIFLMACSGTSGSTSDVPEDGVSEILLYDANNVKVKIKAAYSVEEKSNNYVLLMENANDQEMDIFMENIVVNQKYKIQDYMGGFVEPLSNEKDSMGELSLMAYNEGLTYIDSIRFHLTIQDENYEVIEESDFDIVFEKPLVHALEYNKFMDAKAAQQVLYEDEKLKLTLVEWGQDPSNKSYISAIVCFENNSDETIPVKISGMGINGHYFSGSDSVDFLKPGQKCYGYYSILRSDVEDEGITSISEVNLLILTDESQNTGIVNYDGGIWYPIVLEEQGDVEENFVEGEVLYEAEDVRVSYIDQEKTEWTDGGGHYAWNLAVVNNSEENIRVSMIDVLVDGIPKDSWETNDQNIYLASADVPAHSNRYVDISTSFYGELLPQPEIQFRFQLRTMSGGAVIATSEETITLTPEYK